MGLGRALERRGGVGYRARWREEYVPGLERALSKKIGGGGGEGEGRGVVLGERKIDNDRK